MGKIKLSHTFASYINMTKLKVAETVALQKHNLYKAVKENIPIRFPFAVEIVELLGVKKFQKKNISIVIQRGNATSVTFRSIDSSCKLVDIFF